MRALLLTPLAALVCCARPMPAASVDTGTRDGSETGSGADSTPSRDSNATSDSSTAQGSFPYATSYTTVQTYCSSGSGTATTGVAARITLPTEPRFDTAPVAVGLVGGLTSGSFAGADAGEVQKIAQALAAQGFVVVEFEHPGATDRGAMDGATHASCGVYDYRGPNSRRFLADILKFATGGVTDTAGLSLADLAGVAVSSANVGLVGFSNGGNLAIETLSRDPVGVGPARIPRIAFYTGFENPVNDMTLLSTSASGPGGVGQNTAYTPGSCYTSRCAVDYSELKQSSTDSTTESSESTATDLSFNTVYFDNNANGVFDGDPSKDPSKTYVGDTGVLNTDVYAHAAYGLLAGTPTLFFDEGTADQIDANRSAFSFTVPVATAAQSAAYFKDRLAGMSPTGAPTNYQQAVLHQPGIRIIVSASVVDHGNMATDHDHVGLQYDGWAAANPSFIQLNPSKAYLSAATGCASAQFMDNAPAGPYDTTLLEPEGSSVTDCPALANLDMMDQVAAVMELADRTQDDDDASLVGATQTLH